MMTRKTVVLFLIMTVFLFLIFEISDRNATAQDTGSLNQVLQNQKIILEKLETLDKKLDVIKMRIRL